MSRILITGATGFIGSRLAQKCVDQSHHVAILKRKTSNTERIANIVNDIQVYEADLADLIAIKKAVMDFKPDVIYHLATYYKVEHSPEDLSEMFNVNVLGVINLLESSREINLKLFVNTSTCFVYAPTKLSVNETAQLEPLNLYAHTKIQAEQLCDFYQQKYGLPCITFRLFPPYGPEDNKHRLIPFLMSSFKEKPEINLTTGKQEWDFTYVDDIVSAYLCLLKLQKSFTTHEVFNIGAGQAVSIHDVVMHIKKLLGSSLNPKFGAIEHRSNEVWFTQAVNNKAKEMLGWSPKVKIFEEGLALTIEEYTRS